MLRVAAVAALVALAHAQGRPHFRKSLGFGPDLPNARFVTALAQPGSLSATDNNAEPRVVAAHFLRSLGFQENEWRIRGDSYTDKSTGVSHIYARQVVMGLDVADGNINLNIRGGRVLSYGDSFFRGEVSGNMFGTPPNPKYTQRGFCAVLSDEVAAQMATGGAQQVFGHAAHGVVPSLRESAAHNCHPGAHVTVHPRDARTAALAFISRATDEDGLAASIALDFDSLLDGISTERVCSLSSQAPVENLHGVPGTASPVRAQLAFVQTPTEGTATELNLVFKLEVEMHNAWYDVAVSAIDPNHIFSVVDWVSDSPFYAAPTPPKAKGPSYNVYPWGVNDPEVGERALDIEAYDTLASPLGWHALPLANDPNYSNAAPKPTPENTIINYTTTYGNNVFAQENWQGRAAWLTNYRPSSSTPFPNVTFDFDYSPKASDDSLAEAQSWINATVTQLFYTANRIHDMYYRYGFDEASGNFQQHNFGRGGREDDGVIANAQDGSGFNNANFATPPDGQNGRCRMYIWNTATPYRDGDLEAGIVIHEYSHGMSTRLTGGPSDSSCLGFGEAGGMGEGWGDFLATMIRANKTYSDYAMGAWAANSSKGIRNYIYSTNMTVNPTTYKTLDKPAYWGVHAIGEVWAEMLWVIAQRLIAKHGFADSLVPPPAGDATAMAAFYRADGAPLRGNALAVQLVLDGMKLQPCRPGFFDARDAILQADEILTGGENACEIWAGFASRGLGPDATVIGKTPWGGGVRKDDFALPAPCVPKTEPEPREPEPEDPGKDKKKKKHDLVALVAGFWGW